MSNHLVHRARPMAIGAAVSALALATMAHANGSTARATDGGHVTSGATVSQSMVHGSSPTSLGHSSLARAAVSKSPAAAAAAATEEGPATSGAVAVAYDPRTGAVLSRHRYGVNSEGRRLRMPAAAADHDTGGTSSGFGCIRVTVWQKGSSTLGAWTWTFNVWTDWCWTRSNQVVAMNAIGKGFDTDGHHEWLGIQNHEEYYYDFSTDDGHPKSAYWNFKQGGFRGYGFCCGLPDTFQYPKNTLAAYYNGTWQWWTS